MTVERRVLMIGLGTIARTHLAVLAELPGVTVVGSVDPAAPPLDLPVFRTLDEALGAGPAPDLVTVATPTDTHLALVRELVDRTDALVLSEKPLGVAAADIASVADVADRVRVAHHFAFSPEVEWALAHVRTGRWGRPTRVTSRFNDAYARLGDARLASYVSSWVDSGPNQVSLLEPFTGSFDVVSHADERVRSVTVLDHEGGRTLLTSNWMAGDSSKQTTLEYAGDRHLHLDHTAMTAVVVEDGRVTEHVGYAGTAGRKHAHYRGLYEALVANPDDERLGVALAADIARVLEAAASAPAVAPRWSSIGVAPA